MNLNTALARNKGVEDIIRTTPCDFKRKVTFSILSAVNMPLLLVFSSLINANGHFFAGLIIVIILILLAYVFLVAYFVPIVDVYCETIVNSSLNDCNILDKANDLTVHVHVYNNIKVTNITENTRSHYSKFVYSNKRKHTF